MGFSPISQLQLKVKELQRALGLCCAQQFCQPGKGHTNGAFAVCVMVLSSHAAAWRKLPGVRGNYWGKFCKMTEQQRRTARSSAWNSAKPKPVFDCMLFSCFPKSICAELHAGIQITDHITMITLCYSAGKSPT